MWRGYPGTDGGWIGRGETAYRTEGLARRARDECAHLRPGELVGVGCRGDDVAGGLGMECRPEGGAANDTTGSENELATRMPRLGEAGESKARVMGRAMTMQEMRTTAPPRRVWG